MITSEQVWDDLQNRFGNAVFDKSEPSGLLTFLTDTAHIIEVAKYLFDHKTFQVQFLTSLCGIHYPNAKGKELGVVYHFHSLIHNFRIRIKVFVPIEKPKVPTMSDLHPTANWQERETYDFFGIIFDGHPNLVRILNVDDMDYFPLRKEYPLEDPTRRDKDDSMFGR
ncbi:MAG: NADH-quinone oxidoreductase subunit C [Cytophagales bacterium]|nr:MAG: NADH-quinone oxidoreductase subunit C [Cytophagales bacterium]TAF60841.1 MAG: NADH-quinone oxidoreductase subunit C [Cytophagales bacterium]